MAVDWTKVDEIRLLRWVAEFKPAGLHKHFHMYCIVERMNRPDKYPVVLLQKETVKPGKIFTASEIWEKLNQYYDLDMMDKAEGYELYSERKDFELPWDEYGDLILEHAKGEEEEEEEEEATGTGAAAGAGTGTGAGAGRVRVKEEEQEDNQATDTKRRSTRLRKSSRLNQSRSGSDEEVSGSEPAEGEDNKDQPLAKRTRHSSSSATTTNVTTNNDTSPKKERKKRKADEPTSVSPQPEATPAQVTTTPAVRTSSRVSSRLRNKK